ncbi:MAG: hypothetical protein IK051_01365 [Rhodocyclaceae bacterium]|nr:hypothetical protein [Rhodocyclaceae bacterium]MBR4736296.1 hypothetical protein [Rhodocyclaceae bacterium]
MNKAAKLLDAMRNNPRDWRIEQLITVARQMGMAVRNDGGSHHIFSAKEIRASFPVPAHKPIKPVYVKKFVALVDALDEHRRNQNG